MGEETPCLFSSWGTEGRKGAVFWKGQPQSRRFSSLPRQRYPATASSFTPRRARAAQMKSKSPCNSQRKQTQRKSDWKLGEEAGFCILADNILTIKGAKTHSHGHWKRLARGEKVLSLRITGPSPYSFAFDINGILVPFPYRKRPSEFLGSSIYSPNINWDSTVPKVHR